MIIVDVTNVAVVVSELPNPHSVESPMRCSPKTRTSEDPSVRACGGENAYTLACSWYAKCSRLSLKTPCCTGPGMSLSSTV